MPPIIPRWLTREFIPGGEIVRLPTILMGRADATGNREGDPGRWPPESAAREIPKVGFPFVYFAITRAIARRRPFNCPDCGKPVTI
jgi:hypothetical protein